MESAASVELLRSSRARRGEDLAALSKRTGLRVQHIRAIEEGRFRDLPSGIYGRAAIRSFATAYGLDADAVIAACEGLLPQLRDPIDGLARIRGITPAAAPVAPEASSATTIPHPAWRPFAAAAVDGVVAGLMLLGAAACAALFARVSIDALAASAISLFVLGLILEAAYYTWMGGLSGTTFGEYAVGPEPLRRDPRPLTLRAIALRAIAAATADVRAVYRAGVWVGRLTRDGSSRSAPPPALSPSPLPLRGREEALTWSANRRASVPPPPLRPRHG
jgi:hypothetical protein